MKSFVTTALAVAVLGLTACAGSSSSNGDVPGAAAAKEMAKQFENVDGTLWGAWDVGTFTAEDGSASVTATTYFAEGKVGSKAECHRDGKTVIVTVMAKAAYTEDSIEILENVEATTENGDHTCNVSLKKDTMSYKMLSNDKIQISDLKESKSYTFNRVK
jgi:hypothetical protein